MLDLRFQPDAEDAVASLPGRGWSGIEHDSTHMPRLIYHCRSGEVAQLLVDAGANLEPRGVCWMCDGTGESRFKNDEAFQGRLHLIENEDGQCSTCHGSGDHPLQWTALAWAARQGRADVLTVLLKSGAEIKREESYDEDALAVAVREGHHRCLQILLDHGADLLYNDWFYKHETLLTFARD